MSVASRQAQAAANEIQDTLEERDIQGIAVIGASLAGGLLIANEIASRVAGAVGVQSDSLNYDLVSAGTKVALALGVGAFASSLSGVGLVVVAFVALAHLASAATDVISAFQRTSVGTAAPGSKARRPSSASSGSSSPSSPTSPGSNSKVKDAASVDLSV